MGQSLDRGDYLPAPHASASTEVRTGSLDVLEGRNGNSRAQPWLRRQALHTQYRRLPCHSSSVLGSEVTFSFTASVLSQHHRYTAKSVNHNQLSLPHVLNPSNPLCSPCPYLFSVVLSSRFPTSKAPNALTSHQTHPQYHAEEATCAILPFLGASYHVDKDRSFWTGMWSPSPSASTSYPMTRARNQRRGRCGIAGDRARQWRCRWGGEE